MGHNQGFAGKHSFQMSMIKKKIVGSELKKLIGHDEIRKTIYGHKDGSKAVIMVGYCPDTLAYFNAMFTEAKRSFPNLNAENVICGKVTRSNCVKGYTLIIFDCPNEPVDGWDFYENSQIDFNF